MDGGREKADGRVPVVVVTGYLGAGKTTFVNRMLAARFSIKSIPAMFLLDQQGRIVSTNARGEKLEAEVKRLLKQ